MNTVLRILIGLALTGGGAFMVIRTRAIIDFFGPMDWAEAKLGGGGSVLMYKVIGMILCVVGIIVTTNLWDWFLRATLGSLLPNLGPAAE